MTTELNSAPEKPVAPRKQRKSGVVVPHAPTWYQRVAARLIFVLLRLLAATLRYRSPDSSHVVESLTADPVIFCIWHNRLALSMQAYRVSSRNRKVKGMAALVSASKDGGFLAAILECFHVHPIRGSTSRRGPQALLELTTWSARGYDLAITPDGPRGPCCVVQDGVMALAQLTGLPIVPVSYHARWKIQLKSWDRFQIPLPLSPCDIRFGPPIRVPREASDEERERLRGELQRKMKELSRD